VGTLSVGNRGDRGGGGIRDFLNPGGKEPAHGRDEDLTQPPSRKKQNYKYVMSKRLVSGLWYKIVRRGGKGGEKNAITGETQKRSLKFRDIGGEPQELENVGDNNGRRGKETSGMKVRKDPSVVRRQRAALSHEELGCVELLLLHSDYPRPKNRKRRERGGKKRK